MCVQWHEGVSPHVSCRDCYYDNSTTCPRCARMSERKQDDPPDVKDVFTWRRRGPDVTVTIGEHCTLIGAGVLLLLLQLPPCQDWGVRPSLFCPHSFCADVSGVGVSVECTGNIFLKFVFSFLFFNSWSETGVHTVFLCVFAYVSYVQALYTYKMATSGLQTGQHVMVNAGVLYKLFCVFSFYRKSLINSPNGKR